MFFSSNYIIKFDDFNFDNIVIYENHTKVF